ncbi:MAG TPA: hypothetical protein VMF53_10905 [Alphaproteobacteria bacterium]|nr:hypothetical protein [Alphaproteobacteria bacterium]
MTLEDKSTFTGNDRRTYRRGARGRSEIVNRGKAPWEVPHEANEARAWDEARGTRRPTPRAGSRGPDRARRETPFRRVTGTKAKSDAGGRSS